MKCSGELRPIKQALSIVPITRQHSQEFRRCDVEGSEPDGELDEGTPLRRGCAASRKVRYPQRNSDRSFAQSLRASRGPEGLRVIRLEHQRRTRLPAGMLPIPCADEVFRTHDQPMHPPSPQSTPCWPRRHAGHHDQEDPYHQHDRPRPLVLGIQPRRLATNVITRFHDTSSRHSMRLRNLQCESQERLGVPWSAPVLWRFGICTH